MKNAKMSSVGSIHPVLFFAIVYVVALFLSIFIVSSLFYACNSQRTDSALGQNTTVIPPAAPGDLVLSR